MNEKMTSVTWWNSLSYEERFFRTINWLWKQRLNTASRHPDSLSNEEIQEVRDMYKTPNMFLKRLDKLNETANELLLESYKLGVSDILEELLERLENEQESADPIIRGGLLRATGIIKEYEALIKDYPEKLT